MALQVKRIDDWKPDINGIGKFGGGGGGGSMAGLGLGAIIGGAIAAGIAGGKGGSTSGINAGGSSSSGIVAPGILNPGNGSIPGTEGATAPSVPNTESGASAIPDIGKVESLPPSDQKDTDKQLPLPNLPELDIKDETSTNVEQAIDNSDTLAMLRQLRDEQWAREDAIRSETQEREDTAFRRGIADMRRAGVNVNLVGAQAAESGGGITNATGVDGGIYTAEVNKYVSLLETALNNEFKGNENTKDRITDTIGKLVQAIIVGLMK